MVVVDPVGMPYEYFEFTNPTYQGLLSVFSVKDSWDLLRSVQFPFTLRRMSGSYPLESEEELFFIIMRRRT